MSCRLTAFTFLILTTCFVLVCSAAEPSDPNQSSKYINAVREFADNVLKYGRDTYGPKHTPLFVDGLNIHTHEPVKWIAPNGNRWILCNLASQQNLFRTLDGLTRITGDPKYKQAAMDAIKYAFENLRSPNGLLYWGGHEAYDVGADKPCGIGIHELKAHYPYYELMWEVDPQATKTFIEALWSGHILDWSNLDMNRHCYDMNQALKKPWDYEYKGGVVSLNSQGTCDCLIGSDLCYSAALLNKFIGDNRPLLWSKRFAYRFIETRNPKTGLGTAVYRADAVPIFPHQVWANKAIRDIGPGYEMPTPGAAVIDGINSPWICQLMLGQLLDKDGDVFVQWTVEELRARGKIAYRKSDNVYIPILLDGTSMEGYVCKEDGPLGWKGTTLEPVPAGTAALWAYALAYSLTSDRFMWEMARNIAIGNHYGDLGVSIDEEPQLNFHTYVSDPYVIVVFLELYRKTGKKSFLDMANRIGDNVISGRFREGFFVASDTHVYTKFDAIDSLALLHLHSALEGDADDTLPKVWPAKPFLELQYREKDRAIDNQIIYTLTDSFDVPLSLQEAAAMGNIDLIKSFLKKGINVNSREGTRAWTALHLATTNGHKEIVELLLDKSADTEAKDSWGRAALYYATENGHREIVKLLTAHGADVNTKDINGRTPLDIAVNRGFKDIAELLLSSGAKGSIHTAAQLEDLATIKTFLEEGIDVNVKDARQRTALHYAAREGHKEVVDFLLEHGADVNAGAYYNRTAAEFAMEQNHTEIVKLLISKGADISPLHLALYLKDKAKAKSLIEDGADVNKRTPYGITPLNMAVDAGFNDLAELLINKGADVNAKDNWDWTPLHSAVYKSKEMVEFLIARGANVNAKDGDDRTPLWYAQDEGHTEIVEILRKHGAKE